MFFLNLAATRCDLSCQHGARKTQHNSRNQSQPFQRFSYFHSCCDTWLAVCRLSWSIVAKPSSQGHWLKWNDNIRAAENSVELTEIIFLIIVRWKHKDGCIEPIGPIAESALIKVRHRFSPDQEAQVIVYDNSARIDAQRRVRDLRPCGFSSCRVFFLYFYILYL